MPAITLILSADLPYTPPTEEHRVLQALVYRMISDRKDLHDEVHDLGMGLRNVYKLFTFFRLEQLADGGVFRFEIRAVDSRMIEAIAQYTLNNSAVQVGMQHLAIQGIQMSDTLIRESDIRIRMLTPISLHHTDGQKHRIYVSPLEPEFEEMINSNYINKYRSRFHHDPEEPLTIRRYGENPTLYKTTFKGTIMKGYGGCYHLHGQPNGLTLLYNSGLGASNAQGFGMFDLTG